MSLTSHALHQLQDQLPDADLVASFLTGQQILREPRDTPRNAHPEKPAANPKPPDKRNSHSTDHRRSPSGRRSPGSNDGYIEPAKIGQRGEENSRHRSRPLLQQQPRQAVRKQKRKRPAKAVSEDSSILSFAIQKDVLHTSESSSGEHQHASHRSRCRKELEVVHLNRNEDEQEKVDGRKTKNFEKRPRHKMLDTKKDDAKESRKKTSPTKPKQKKRKGGGGIKGNRKADILTETMTVESITTDRLTLRPSHTLGIYKKGKASSPMTRRGLPDLVFSELDFLHKRSPRNSVDKAGQKINYTKELPKRSSYFTRRNDPAFVLTRTISRDNTAELEPYRHFRNPSSVEAPRHRPRSLSKSHASPDVDGRSEYSRIGTQAQYQDTRHISRSSHREPLPLPDCSLEQRSEAIVLVKKTDIIEENTEEIKETPRPREPSYSLAQNTEDVLPAQVVEKVEPPVHVTCEDPPVEKQADTEEKKPPEPLEKPFLAPESLRSSSPLAALLQICAESPVQSKREKKYIPREATRQAEHAIMQTKPRPKPSQSTREVPAETTIRRRNMPIQAIYRAEGNLRHVQEELLDMQSQSRVKATPQENHNSSHRSTAVKTGELWADAEQSEIQYRNGELMNTVEAVTYDDTARERLVHSNYYYAGEIVSYPEQDGGLQPNESQRDREYHYDQQYNGEYGVMANEDYNRCAANWIQELAEPFEFTDLRDVSSLGEQSPGLEAGYIDQNADFGGTLGHREYHAGAIMDHASANDEHHLAENGWEEEVVDEQESPGMQARNFWRPYRFS